MVHIDLLTTRQSWKELLNWIRCSYYKNTFFSQEQIQVVQKHKMHKHCECGAKRMGIKMNDKLNK